MQPLKIIIEKHPEGYVAYPLGVQGVIVGEGETYEEALADVTSAIQFHHEIFGTDTHSIDPDKERTPEIEREARCQIRRPQKAICLTPSKRSATTGTPLSKQ
jgi:predicted RNase H-like HicB family nuclease